MKATWENLSFLPSEEALDELRRAWVWFLPKTFKPVMASALGDIFFQQDGEEVFWLNTGIAEITRIAKSRTEFLEFLKTKKSDEWFMPDLVQRLIDAGKILKPDYCYTYVILPVFKEGAYEVANFNPVPAREHFGITGAMHRQLSGMPDGGKVQVELVE